MVVPTAFVLNHISDPEGTSKQINLSALAIVRSLGRRKIPTVLVTTNERDGVIGSCFCQKVEFCPYMYDAEQDLLEFLLSLSDSYPGEKVLIPAIDECAYFVGKYYRDLERKFHIPAPDWDTANQINNKRYQYELAETLGLAIPETYFPSTIDEVMVLSRRLRNYPYVIKPNVSFEWKLRAMRSRAHGKKGIRVDNAEELVARARDILVPGYDFMVQEVIGGRDERLVTFLSYFDRDSKPHSYFVRRKIRQCPVDFGYCTMTESCHDDVVVQQSITLLQALNFHGICGVEWKLDPVTESYKLIEINARTVNTTGCAMAAGVDLPAVAYFDSIGQSLPGTIDWQDGLKWGWLSMDFWAGRQLVSEGKLTFAEWLQSIRTITADAVFARDDLWFSCHYYGGFLRRILTARVSMLVKAWKLRVSNRSTQPSE